MVGEGLRLSTESFETFLSRLGSKSHLAQVRALKRAGVSARQAMAPAIATDAALKQSQVKDAIAIDESRIEGAHMVRLVCTGSRLPLVQWVRNAQPGVRRRGGVSARLPGGAGRYPRAFIARMRSGHVGVFERADGATRRGPAPNRSQLPIRELFGPSIVQVFRKYRPLGATAGLESLEKNLAHELKWAMEQSA